MADQQLNLQKPMLLLLPLSVFYNFLGFGCFYAESAVLSIHWNSSNSLFNRSPASLLFTVHLQDKMDLICPQYKRGTLPEKLEVSLLYMVDRIGYESCSVNSNARLVGLCTSPYNREVITVVFRPFTPNPGGLEFEPGQRYYIITTSEGSMKQLQNSNGGLCFKKNMRLQLDVKEAPPPTREKFQVPAVDDVGKTSLRHKHPAVLTVIRSNVSAPRVDQSDAIDDGDQHSADGELRKTGSNEISGLTYKVQEMHNAPTLRRNSNGSSSHHRLHNGLRFCLAVLFLLSLIVWR